MDIEIKRLSPALLEDYLRLFDTTPHDDGIDAHKCYCVCWSSADAQGVDDSTPERRRALAIEYVTHRALDGYLAYCDGRVIGWCNANAKKDCLLSKCGRLYLRPSDPDAAPDPANVKSVFCFVIAPEMRRKGVASRLLERVCVDAAEEGFDVVEAYPVKTFISPQADYMGPARLYEKHGFTPYFDYGDRLIVRKACR